MGAAAGEDVEWHGRAPAGLGEERGRRFLVGLGVLGPGDRRQARSQGGPGPRRWPEPTGAARGLQGGATAGVRSRRPGPSPALTPAERSGTLAGRLRAAG